MHWVSVTELGLCLVAVIKGYSLLQCTGFLLWWFLLLQSRGFRGAARVFSRCSLWAPRRAGFSSYGLTGSRVRAQSLCLLGFNCFTACGIFSCQGLKWYPLNWQVDSYRLCHQGSPHVPIFKFSNSFLCCV